jgi:hypothetical protein
VRGDHPRPQGRGIVLAAHWVWLSALMLGGLFALGLGLRRARARPRR